MHGAKVHCNRQLDQMGQRYFTFSSAKMAVEVEGEWRVVKARPGPVEGAIAGHEQRREEKLTLQGPEAIRGQELLDLTRLVGAPIKRADVATSCWPPSTVSESVRDKIGEGFYLRTPIPRGPLPPDKTQGLFDAGEWPSMGVPGSLTTPQLPSWSKVLTNPAPVVPRHTKAKQKVRSSTFT